MKKMLMFALALGGVAGVAGTSFAKDNVCSPTAHQTDLRQAIKWYRDSAEQKALYQQTFVIGAQYVKAWANKYHPKAKSWGVVLDIDETTLDNSWYFYQCDDVLNNETGFSNFITMAKKSTALPGVVAFTHTVHDLGGYVSLISNRDGSYKDAKGTALSATVDNLKQQKVYFDQVLLANHKQSKRPQDKNPRFNAVLKGTYDKNEMVATNPLPAHTVVAYFGDNIQDFPGLNQKTMNAKSADDKAYTLFGHGYFLLPNPLYGSWAANSYR